MTTKNKIFLSFGIIILAIIVGSIGYYTNKEPAEITIPQIETGIVENTGITNNFLTDDNVSGLTGCTDLKFLNEFSGYTLVKKIAEDGDTYDIYVYDTNLDLSGITDKINIIEQKGKIEEDKMNQLDIIASGYQSSRTGIINIMYGQSIDNSLEESYRAIDIIHSMVNNSGAYECYLESENNDGGTTLGKVDKSIINNLDKFLGSIISGKLDISYKPSLGKVKENEGYLFTNKTYKDGVLSIEAGGNDGFGVYLGFIKVIGNTIYTIDSKPFLYISDVEIGDEYSKITPKKLYDGTNREKEVKDLNCSNDKDCEKKANIYIKNLFNGTEFLDEYSKIHDEFLTKIDEIFGN